ncbi:MAG: hypothetical protein R3Y56_10960, partial [Akkermansia sp.]
PNKTPIMKNTHSLLSIIALSGILLAGTATQAQANVVTAPVKVVEKTTKVATKPVGVAVKGTGGILKKVVKAATAPLKILAR